MTREFIQKVKTMRAHQKAWFSWHRTSDLQASIRLEREVDAAIVQFENEAASLFPPEGEKRDA